jgi:hypothetical protein
VRSSIDGRCAFLTLFAFAVVLLGVLALHITQPGLDRPFRAPGDPDRCAGRRRNVDLSDAACRSIPG